MKRLFFAAIMLLGCVSNNPAFRYDNGLAQYNLPVPSVIGSLQTTAFDNQSVTTITFQGRGAVVPAVIRKPATPNGVGIVVLPGALVKKEGEDASVAAALAEVGFTTITLDQRGTGESQYAMRSPEENYKQFMEGKESDGLLMAADAIMAGKLLQQNEKLNKIIYLGESMGGRNAIIAAAITKNPVVAISTGGINAPAGAEESITAFVGSYDPAAYAPLITQRAVVLHGPIDPAIPLNSGLQLYGAINSRKQFAQLPCNDHGYCNDAKKLLQNAALWAAGLIEEFA